MRAVIYQSCYIVFWHFGELFLKDALETRQDDDALTAVVIVDYAELNLPFALL